GDVNKAYSVSVFEGLKNANVHLDQELTSIYEVYMKEERAKIPPKAMFFLKDELVPEKTWTEAELTRAAKANDVAIFTLGRTSGEFQDRIEAGDFELTATELELISNLKKAFAAEGKPLVVLLNVGGVTETNSWKTLADAILLTWQPGQEAGNAITDLLLGKANPSGKLPVTFPIALDDVPSSKNFPGIPLDPNAEKPANPLQGIPSEEIYEEGIYVGYRYFDTFEVPVSYRFGYGMSYTTFEYSDLQVESGATISVSFTVKNTGSVAGKEIAQLYVSAPEGTLEKPSKELKAFEKTALLEPGASETITLEINPESLASYDDKKHAWILDGGTYTLSIADNIASSKLKATLEIEATTVRETEALLVPKKALN
ncbi:MAG: glycoside hydrolase family 3 C-terminal domain-containing protein, partial [Bacteroidota bacterium]|nr:glycoside hydrolase family 3 C-terminal domain-containing protein [Bacteroidota bacterium]